MHKWLKVRDWGYAAASITLVFSALSFTVFFNSVFHSVISIVFIGCLSCALDFLFSKMTQLHLSGWHGGVCVLVAAFFCGFILASPVYALSLISLLLVSLLWCLFFFGGLYRGADSREKRISVVLLFLGCAFFALIGWHKIGSFNPDSIYFYLISQSIGNDFGNMSLIRQYVLDTSYNISFPYLYPVMLYIADVLFGMGLSSGIPLNCILFVLTSLLLFHGCLRFSGRIWPAALVIFSLCTAKSYIQEILSTCSIPLCLLLSAACIYLTIDLFLSTQKRFGVSGSDKTDHNSLFSELNTPVLKNDSLQLACMGALAGAAAVTRFDAAILLAMCGCCVVFMQKGARIRSGLIYAAGAALFLIPWMIYSLVHFQTLWITDNAGTMFYVTPEPPHRVALDSDLTIFNAPGAWFVALLKKSVAIVKSMCMCSVSAVIIVILGIVSCIRHRKDFSRAELCITCAVALYLLAKTAMYILVGYPDQRYHIETILCAMLLVTILYVRHSGRGDSLDSTRLSSNKTVAVCIVLFVVLSLGSNLNSVRNVLTLPGGKPLHALMEIPESYTTLDRELTHHGVNANENLLCVGDDKLTRGQRLSMWFHRHVYTVYLGSSGPTPAKITTILDKHPQITYVLVSKTLPKTEQLLDVLESKYPKEELSKAFLFKIQRNIHETK